MNTGISLDELVGFGKYKYSSYRYVLEKDPEYLVWMYQTMPGKLQGQPLAAAEAWMKVNPKKTKLHIDRIHAASAKANAEKEAKAKEASEREESPDEDAIEAVKIMSKMEGGVEALSAFAASAKSNSPALSSLIEHILKENIGGEDSVKAAIANMPSGITFTAAKSMAIQKKDEFLKEKANAEKKFLELNNPKNPMWGSW